QSSHLSPGGRDSGGSRSDDISNANSNPLANVPPSGNNLGPPQCDPNAYRAEPNACDNARQQPCKPQVQNDIITPGIHLIAFRIDHCNPTCNSSTDSNSCQGAGSSGQGPCHPQIQNDIITP